MSRDDRERLARCLADAIKIKMHALYPDPEGYVDKWIRETAIWAREYQRGRLIKNEQIKIAIEFIVRTALVAYQNVPDEVVLSLQNNDAEVLIKSMLADALQHAGVKEEWLTERQERRKLSHIHYTLRFALERVDAINGQWRAPKIQAALATLKAKLKNTQKAFQSSMPFLDQKSRKVDCIFDKLCKLISDAFVVITPLDKRENDFLKGIEALCVAVDAIKVDVNPPSLIPQEVCADIALPAIPREAAAVVPEKPVVEVVQDILARYAALTTLKTGGLRGFFSVETEDDKTCIRTLREIITAPGADEADKKRRVMNVIVAYMAKTGKNLGDNRLRGIFNTITLVASPADGHRANENVHDTQPARRFCCNS